MLNMSVCVCVECEINLQELAPERSFGRLDPSTTAMWPFSLFSTPKWKIISKEKLEARNALIQQIQSGLSAEATTAGEQFTRASGPSWSFHLG
jgi:hypothetical protein